MKRFTLSLSIFILLSLKANGADKIPGRDFLLNKILQNISVQGARRGAIIAAPSRDETFFFPTFYETLDWNTPRKAVSIPLKEYREFLEDSKGYPELDSKLQKLTDKIADILKKEFPKNFGRKLPIDVRAAIRIYTNSGGQRMNWVNFTDFIHRKIHIFSPTTGNPQLYLRVLAHETLHLNGKSDEPLLLLGLTGLREGLIEYLTIKLLSRAGEVKIKNNKIWKSAEFYRDWVRTIEEELVDKLFQGDDTPLVDLYITGDVNDFATKFKIAWENGKYSPDHSAIDRDANDFMKGLYKVMMDIK